MHRTICSLIRICRVALVCVPAFAFSQSSLKGRITDAKTGEPVPYANVFFNNTTIGNATTVDGSYEIRNIPSGKFDLTVSVIGYTRFQKPLEFPGTTELNIKLSPDPVLLSEVTIHGDKADTKKYFPLFQKYFIGESANARSSVIKNPETIHLYYEKEDKTLTAHASEPIVVENPRLGYRLYYILDNFTLDNKDHLVSVFGVPRFEELPIVDKKDSVKRDRRRKESYNGSLNHFMRALYRNRLKEEEFRVTRLIDPHVGASAYQAAETQIEPADFLTGIVSKVFRFKGTLKIEYMNELEPPEYRRTKTPGYQVSYITFKKDYITIFENGYYMDQNSVFIDGFFGWAEKIGELIPLSYYPITTKER